MAMHEFHTIITFADDTTVVGLITDNDETAYKEKGSDLAVWCQDNNLSPQRQQDKLADCGLQEIEGRARPHAHQQGCSGAGRELQNPWFPHH